MRDSWQDVYAKNLQHANYGYPLRMPEPMSILPPDYQEIGLEIGDVGVVRREGQFDVLFNICKPHDHLLHEERGVPQGFHPIKCGRVTSNANAISPGPIHSYGIKQVLQHNKMREADYEFHSSAPAGAILILPKGATSAELVSPEEFREVASKNALDWYEFANKYYDFQHLDPSLYLVTGFHKAPSWTLGSFINPTMSAGEILAQRDDQNTYLLKFAFSADRRHSGGDGNNGNVNQTVFITGFRITPSSWLPGPIVRSVTEPDTTWSMLVYLFNTCLKGLRGYLNGTKQDTAGEHTSPLSQPFYPPDVINRFLLKKNPNAKIAITHDNQWMDMMKEGLTHQDLFQEERLETFLTQHYAISLDTKSETRAVFLQGKDSVVDSDAQSLGSLMSDPPSSELEDVPSIPEPGTPPSETPECEMSLPLTSEVEFPMLPVHSPDDRRTVITHIRIENIPCGFTRIPAGFFILVQFKDAQRRTRTQSTQLNDRCIEWEDKILLPSTTLDMVRFTVYASFELEPVLGNGEALFTTEICVDKLVGGTHLITFSPGPSGTDSEPSMLITIGRWYFDTLEIASSVTDLDPEQSSVLVRETELGQEALLRYYKEYQHEDLKFVLRQFERAWEVCHSDHLCRAVVLVNLARAKFFSYRVDPTGSSLDKLISLYRQALDLQSPNCRNRPGTLLQLAETLLYRYEKWGCDESTAKEIKGLMNGLQKSSNNSHERRAADLVLETLERCRVVNSGEPVELNDLVQQLRRSMETPPDNYFDRPQRSINLGATLWRRYEKFGTLSDLDDLLEIDRQALRLLPGPHPDRSSVLRTLRTTLRTLYELRKDTSYLTELNALGEDAEAIDPDFMRLLVELGFNDMTDDGSEDDEPSTIRRYSHKDAPYVVMVFGHVDVDIASVTNFVVGSSINGDSPNKSHTQVPMFTCHPLASLAHPNRQFCLYEAPGFYGPTPNEEILARMRKIDRQEGVDLFVHCFRTESWTVMPSIVRSVKMQAARSGASMIAVVTGLESLDKPGNVEHWWYTPLADGSTNGASIERTCFWGWDGFDAHACLSAHAGDDVNHGEEPLWDRIGRSREHIRRLIIEQCRGPKRGGRTILIDAVD